jgi:hypothetical protein
MCWLMEGWSAPVLLREMIDYMRTGKKVVIIDVLADGGMDYSCATQREGRL